jgi:hypothetical protein
MKKLLLIAALLVVSLTTFSQSNYEYYKNYCRSLGWNIGNEQYANLTQGNSAYTYMNFSSGSTYKIIACSNDNDVTDVDVFVYLSDGTLFMKDTDASSIAVVTFNCTYSQQVKIVIKNYASRTPNYASRIRYFIAWY